MSCSIKSEAETVIKKILPYLLSRGYDIANDLYFEPAIQTENFKKGYIDIQVNCGKKTPLFIIEAKKISKKLDDKDKKQALMYGKAVKVNFVVLTNGNDIRCYNTFSDELIKWNGKNEERIPGKEQLQQVLAYLKTNKDATDIPIGNDSSLPFRPGLALKQINALFSRCHNSIRKIEKNEENAFADFSKFLFLKLLEEKDDNSLDFDLPYSYRFHELAVKPESENDQVKNAINSMIINIRDNTPYGEVLDSPIHLKNPKTFKKIVKELADVSFQNSSLDSKGAAFEYFVRATLKGKKLGQYFTPRPLVELMLTLVGKEKVITSLLSGTEIKVLDPACGTGGFLVYQMQEALKLAKEKLQDNLITQKTYNDIVEKIKRKVFYGSDANEGVACSAKMNMIVAGDGHTNIKNEDSLSIKALNWNVKKPDCDLILTNPPFGTSERESLTGEDETQFPIKSTKGQYLFLQKMVETMVPGGEICTVIDEGVLNTDSSADLRKFLFKKCKIKAIVALPEETFKPNKINVKSSILYMQKYETDDLDFDNNYKIAFCYLKSLGYTGAGEKIRGFDFEALKSDISKNLFKSINKEEYWDSFTIESSTITKNKYCRLDYKYWNPSITNQIEEIKKSKNCKTIKDLNKIKTARGKSPNSDLYVDERDGYALVIKAGTNINKFGQLIENGDFIEKNIYDEINTEKIIDGDILLSSTGDGTLGKCCVYRSQAPAIADGHVTVIRVNTKEIYPEYLCDYLRIGFGAKQVERLYTGSTGLIELTPENIDGITVDLLNSVDEQKTISKELRNKEQWYLKTVNNAEKSLLDFKKTFSNY